MCATRQSPSSFVGTFVQFAPSSSILCVYHKENICSEMDTKGSLSGQLIWHLTHHILPFSNINTPCCSPVIENHRVLVAVSISWEGIWVLGSVILKNKSRSTASYGILKKFKFCLIFNMGMTEATMWVYIMILVHITESTRQTYRECHKSDKSPLFLLEYLVHWWHLFLSTKCARFRIQYQTEEENSSAE